jgi:hypothetical protein
VGLSPYCTETLHVPLKVKFTPQPTITSQRGSRGIQVGVLSLKSVLDGGGWLTSHPGGLTLENDPAPIVYEAEWVPEPVWTGAENLASTGIR